MRFHTFNMDDYAWVRNAPKQARVQVKLDGATTIADKHQIEPLASGCVRIGATGSQGTLFLECSTPTHLDRNHQQDNIDEGLQWKIDFEEPSTGEERTLLLKVKVEPEYDTQVPNFGADGGTTDRPHLSQIALTLDVVPCWRNMSKVRDIRLGLKAAFQRVGSIQGTSMRFQQRQDGTPIDDTKPFSGRVEILTGMWTLVKQWTMMLEYTVIIGKPRPRIIEPGQDLAIDMDILFETEEGGDVTIQCKDGSFKANKLILSARSEFFRGMFNSQNRESLSGQVDFVEETIATMKAVVRFLYSGQIAEYDVTDELLKAAHFLRLTPLKDKCDAKLAEIPIDEDNVFDHFVFAHVHSAEVLKKKTSHFLLNHYGMDGLKELEAWKNLKKAHPDMVFEFLESNQQQRRRRQPRRVSQPDEENDWPVAFS